MRKEKMTLELRVGIFVIVTIVAVLIFIFIQATRSNYRGYEIGVTFDYVSGLETGSPVRVSGVRAGEVRSIEILYEDRPKVLTKLRLRQDIKIGRYSRVTIQTLGIIGEKYIEITPSSYREYVQPGEVIIGENPLSIERLAEATQGIVVRLNDIMIDINKLTADEKLRDNFRNIINNSALAIQRIDNAFEKIEWVADTLIETNEKAQDILVRTVPKVDTLLDNTNELVVSGKTKMEGTLDEIKRFAQAGTSAAESIQGIKETADAYGEVAEDLRGLISNLQSKGLVAKMMQEEELLDQIKEEVILLHNATRKFQETTETINNVSEDVNIIISGIKEGQGTLGKLLMSDELYMDISGLIKDIKENPWKIFFHRRSPQ